MSTYSVHKKFNLFTGYLLKGDGVISPTARAKNATNSGRNDAGHPLVTVYSKLSLHTWCIRVRTSIFSILYRPDLKIDLCLFGDEVGQILAVTFKPLVPLQWRFPGFLSSHHHVRFFHYRRHYVCTIPEMIKRYYHLFKDKNCTGVHNSLEKRTIAKESCKKFEHGIWQSIL